MTLEEIRNTIVTSEVWKKLGLDTLEWQYRALACAALMTTVAPVVNTADKILTDDTQQTIEMTDKVQQNKDLIAVIGNNNTEISTDSETVNNETNKWSIENASTKWESDWNTINDMLAWGEANDTASTGTVHFETVQQQNKKAFDALFISTATWYHSKDAKRIEELAESVGLWSDEAFDNAIVYIVTNLQGREIDFWGWGLTSEQQRQLEEKWRVKNWNTFVWGGTEVAAL